MARLKVCERSLPDFRVFSGSESPVVGETSARNLTLPRKRNGRKLGAETQKGGSQPRTEMVPYRVRAAL